MPTRLQDLGVSDEELGCGRLAAGSPRDVVAWTPLQYACAVGDAELALELIAASPEAVNALGNTKFAYSPLHIAVRYGHEAVVKLLLAASPAANVNAVDDRAGCTPLHLATLQGNVAILKLLLDESSVQQLVSKNGTTPVELAEELELSDVRALLVDHAARASSRAQLANWLASIGLVEYAPSFFDEGFDDAAFLLETGGLDDTTLDAMRVHKAGHRAKLKSLYQLEEFLDVEEDDSGVSEEEDSSSGDDSEAEGSDSEEVDASASEGDSS